MKILAVLLLISASACAQIAPSPTPPQEPLLNRAPIPSQWTVSLKPQQGAPSAGTKQILTVTKGQDAISEILTNEHGATIETWHVSGVAVMKAGGSAWQFLPGIDNNFESTDYSNSDFAGFEWISPANFAGIQDVQGKHCLVFIENALTMDPREVALNQANQLKEYGDKIAAILLERARKGLPKNSSSPTPAPPVFDISQRKVRVVAYIEDTTRLPVILTYGTGEATMVRIYQFQPASAPLIVPPEVQQILDSHKARQQRQSRPIAPI